MGLFDAEASDEEGSITFGAWESEGDLKAFAQAEDSTGSHNFRAKLKEWSWRQQVALSKKEQARQEREQQELNECTFRPKINVRSEFYARRARGCFAEPLAERLHHEADKRAALRKKAKELLDADAMCDYTFHPQINKSRHLQRTRRASEPCAGTQAAKAAKAAATEVQESFQPHISARSARIVQKKRDEAVRAASKGDRSSLKQLGPVEERLYADAQAWGKRRQERKEESAVEPSPAVPSINEESRKICSTSVYFHGAQQDFVTRQRTFEMAKQKRLEVRSQHLSVKCPFKPSISEGSRQLISKNFHYMGESSEDLVERLAVRDVEKREQRIGDLQHEQYRECTFHPAIDPKSLEIASTSNGPTTGAVHERLYRSAATRSKSVEDLRYTECTFQPSHDGKIAKRYKHVQSHYAFGDGKRIMEKVKEDMMKKEEHLQELRQAKEEEESANCTFSPLPAKQYEDPDEIVVVSGLSRFFELREMAARLQQEHQLRETKIYRPNTAAARFDGVTIPEPFSFCGEQRSRDSPPSS
mmetsp:Transcript_40746/g.93781  ORF Transcript_40746/g.93781 Transcript_40746/m.93781 type:complete len:531 (+) Transcript_40746:89-1681(+)